MKIESLMYFIELVHCGSFYGTAKNLFISQQGLNKAITQLEAELGFKLVERSRHGIRLTSKGEVFLRYANQIVNDYDAMVDDLVNTPSDEEDDSPISTYVSYYAAQLASFNEQYVRMLSERTSYLERPFEQLISNAKNSDGSDLCYLDLHSHSYKDIVSQPNVSFDLTLTTQYGFVWKEGSSLTGESLLHRDAVASKPVAMNSSRDMEKFWRRLFSNNPLKDIRLGTTSPQMLLEYVQTSNHDVIATFDSFAFHLAKTDKRIPTEGLHFTPLSTPEAMSYVGFLYPKHSKLTAKASHTVKSFKRYLLRTYGDYFQQYPLA